VNKFAELQDRFVTPPVSVIIPALDEEQAVGDQIQNIARVLNAEGIPYEIIVVDDGSTDRTAERAAQAGARVLRHLENRGYGASIKTGIDAAQFDTIVISDADGTYPSDQIPALVAQLEAADMVVGARTTNVSHVPLARRPAKWILGKLANQIAGRNIPDLNSGLRAFRRDCIKQYFPILSNQFSFTTTSTLALLADDYRVVYHPIDYYPRVGESKIKPRHFMDFIMLVLRMAMLFQPMKIFVPLALTCAGLGVLKILFDVASYYPRTGHFDWSLLFQPVLSTSAVLLLIVALQLLLIGMVADGALRRIAQHNGPLVPSHGVRVVETRAFAPTAHDVAVND
jgi:glycosyltransferase involved in cell wall biosynthesis